MPPIEIQLNEYFAAFVRARAGQGPYRDATEVVEAALRLLEQSEQRLRNLIDEGDDPNDPGTPADEVFARLEEKYRRMIEEQENNVGK